MRLTLVTSLVFRLSHCSEFYESARWSPSGNSKHLSLLSKQWCLQYPHHQTSNSIESIKAIPIEVYQSNNSVSLKLAVPCIQWLIEAGILMHLQWWTKRPFIDRLVSQAVSSGRTGQIMMLTVQSIKKPLDVLMVIMCLMNPPLDLSLVFRLKKYTLI